MAIGSIGLGTVVASLVIMKRKSASDPWKDFSMGLLLLMIIPVVMGIVINIKIISIAKAIILFACLVGGVGNGLLTIQVSTLLQILSPTNLLGRLSGIFQATVVTGQLCGILLTPLIVQVLLSMQNYFYFSAAAILILFIFVIINYKRKIQSQLDFLKI